MSYQLTKHQRAELSEYADGEAMRWKRPNRNLIRRNLLTLAPSAGQGFYRITDAGRVALALANDEGGVTMHELAHDAGRETAGTLCRMIPIGVIDGATVKYRVEHGDEGGCLGVVMNELRPEDTPWAAFRYFEEQPYREPAKLGAYPTAAAAALMLAIDRFANGLR